MTQLDEDKRPMRLSSGSAHVRPLARTGRGRFPSNITGGSGLSGGTCQVGSIGSTELDWTVHGDRCR